jgi:hypothetical protein
MLAKGAFIPERLDQICIALNLEYLELIESINEEVIR